LIFGKEIVIPQEIKDLCKIIGKVVIRGLKYMANYCRKLPECICFRDVNEREGKQEIDCSCIMRGKGKIRGILCWKLPIKDLLFFVKCINFVLFIANSGENKSYFSPRYLCITPPVHTTGEKVFLHRTSFRVLFFWLWGTWRREWDREREGRCAGGVPAATTWRSEPAISTGGGVSVLPPIPDGEGRSGPRRPQGDGSPLIIDMEATRRAVSESLVVGRFLSPIQVNPQILVDELRACSAWKLQGGVTIQGVAS
jgi:hypothetical protein